MFVFKTLLASTCLLVLIQGLSSAPTTTTSYETTSYENRTILPGGEFPVDVNDTDVKKFAQLGLEEFSRIFEKSYEPIIVKINNATEQIVSGAIFKINVTFGESNCAKGKKTNCVLKQNGEHVDCTVEVYSQPWIDHDSPKANVTCGLL